ncbi:MAG: hypothetical protein HC821_03090 [Lewinella sp.]|nr:hypothetical protein [Lewinella sp.]
MSEIILTYDGVDPVDFFGENNRKLALLRAAYPEATITHRGDTIKIRGEKKRHPTHQKPLGDDASSAQRAR